MLCFEDILGFRVYGVFFKRAWQQLGERQVTQAQYSTRESMQPFLKLVTARVFCPDVWRTSVPSKTGLCCAMLFPAGLCYATAC